MPDEAVVETKIRASSLERIQEVQEMIDRAYDGAAYAFGGKIERERIPDVYKRQLLQHGKDIAGSAARICLHQRIPLSAVAVFGKDVYKRQGQGSR